MLEAIDIKYYSRYIFIASSQNTTVTQIQMIMQITFNIYLNQSKIYFILTILSTQSPPSPCINRQVLSPSPNYPLINPDSPLYPPMNRNQISGYFYLIPPNAQKSSFRLFGIPSKKVDLMHVMQVSFHLFSVGFFAYNMRKVEKYNWNFFQEYINISSTHCL